jgi:hypothetical protein
MARIGSRHPVESIFCAAFSACVPIIKAKNEKSRDALLNPRFQQGGVEKSP